MMPKKSIFLILLLVAVVLITPLHQASALEVNYPALTFPGGPYRITDATSIVELIKYIFIFFIVAAGIIAAISIVYYGGKILVYSTVGNPEVIGDARKNIFGILFGVALLFFSFILLNTINPELVTLRDPGFANRAKGMYYGFQFGGQWYFEPAPGIEDDLIGVLTEKADENFWSMYNDASAIANTPLYLYYYCIPPNKNALVWLYSKKDFKIDAEKNKLGDDGRLPEPNEYGSNAQANNERMVRLTCAGQGQPIGRAVEGGGTTHPNLVKLLDPSDVADNALSWEWDYEQTGAYFYFTKNCTGIPTGVKKEAADNYIKPVDSSDIPIADRKVQSVRITNGSNPKEVYGVYPVKGDSCSSEPIIYTDQPTRADLAGLPQGLDGEKQTLAEIVKTRCFAIPEVPAGTAFDPTSAYIFHYRKGTQNLSGHVLTFYDKTRAVKLYELDINTLKNTPSADPAANPPTTSLYWKFDKNPDELLTDRLFTNRVERYQNPPPPDCNAAAGQKNNCIKSLQFNYRKSYTVFLRSKSIDTGNFDICRPYTDTWFLPFSSAYFLNRYVYRMDVIPTYQKSGF